MRSASVGLVSAGLGLRSAGLYGRGDAAKRTGKGWALNILSVNRIAERLFHELFDGGRGIRLS